MLLFTPIIGKRDNIAGTPVMTDVECFLRIIYIACNYRDSSGQVEKVNERVGTRGPGVACILNISLVNLKVDWQIIVIGVTLSASGINERRIDTFI